jgi:hypothetical protein
MSLPTQLQEYIHKSRYARWLTTENRREHWEETVQRYVDYFDNKFPHFPKEEIKNAILSLKTMPSMRALMTAGPALERDPIAGFNCSFVAIDDTRAFDEILYILMCGTGVGFSVERQYIAQLPIVGIDIGFTNGKPVIQTKDKLQPIDVTIVVEDSKQDKSNLYNLGAKGGEWVVVSKVYNDAVWNEIKLGKYGGYSIEAMYDGFEQLQSKSQEEKLIEQLKQIINK